MPADLPYQIALTLVPHIGSVHAKILTDLLGSASNIFQAKKSLLEKIEGIGSARAKSIKSFSNFGRVDQELAFIEKYKIQPLFLTDPAYPRRLLNCYDSPTLLYYRGNADLNAPKIISVIGTRNHSEYGRTLTENLIKDLAQEDILVVSGLAFGIDALAHRAALKNNLKTIGVLGHGLDKMYPPEHAYLAKDMLLQGGLLTEFRSRTKPDKHHFPIRNRIVAGMSDATVVIETGKKGGSMITAELANGYNKDVFAFPGRTTDPKSSGCNDLIRQNKAVLLTDTLQLVNGMGWDLPPADKHKIKKQRELFISLTDVEKKILDLLQEKQSLPIDEILSFVQGHNSMAASAILRLEMEGLVRSLPGKIYACIN